MTSSKHGTRTSGAEVTNIDTFGIWILLSDSEHFLPYEKFPWFRHATVDQIINVVTFNAEHLHWPELDIDLSIESIRNPASFPLIYK